ncbi:MAG TPA: sigma-70 family RNA polymerase sigma factor [Polyangia bacterium]|nr:sigma-70 family RNA polymerase sigma factor [Polyangia bacterium]
MKTKCRPTQTRTRTSHAPSAPVPGDQIALYLREVQRQPQLSPAEERALATQYHETRDPALGRRLANANLWLVVWIARSYPSAREHLSDLVQEGNLGLLLALRKYDPGRGVRFASYAAFWIRAYMLRFLVNNRSLVKIGTTQGQRKLFFTLRKEKRKLEALGCEPTPEVLAERLRVTVAEVEEMECRMGSSELSLDEPTFNGLGYAGEGARTLRRDALTAPSEERPDVRYENEELTAQLHKGLTGQAFPMDERERLLLERRWLAEEPAVLQELGALFGVSRERVRQIERRLLAELRSTLGEVRGARPKAPERRRGPARREMALAASI